MATVLRPELANVPDAPFEDASDAALGLKFLAQGHVVLPVEDRALLERIRSRVAGLAARHLGLPAPKGTSEFLNSLHDQVRPEALNALRLEVIQGINREPWFRPAYFALARHALAALAGNELAMQRRINLSIQMPEDDSSLLAVHSDVWSGDSPFELVVWLPLVDCFGTKSMYLCPPDANRAVQAKLASFEGKSAEALYGAIENHVRFLDVAFGQMLVFHHDLLHGNRVNTEDATRWSLNCRFKSVFSPYADKKLGEFFEPITLKPLTRLGMAHRLPGGFDD